MKIRLISCVLIACSTIAIAQNPPSLQKSNQDNTTKTPGAKGAQANHAGASESSLKSTEITAVPPAVAPDAPVITISGLCAAGASEPNCTKKVTRADFDKLVNALQPDMPPQGRRQLGSTYVQMMTVANEGEKLGINKDPSFEERLMLSRLQVMAQMTAAKLQQTAKPTEQEIGTFYTENGNHFEELSLRRIYLPKSTGNNPSSEAGKALADKIHARLVAGEDPDKLESEAYVTLKAPGTPPSTNLGWKRQGAIDARYEKQIAALHAGEVSEVLDDPQGYSIYKVESKRMIQLKTVEKDIENVLERQKFEEKMKQLLGSVKADFNENYFGPMEQPQSPPRNGGVRPAPALQPTSPPKK